MVITIESTLSGLFSNNPERVEHYLELIESKELLENSFRDFLYSRADIIMEEGEEEEQWVARQERYRQFVLETISERLLSKKYRERVASFLAVLEVHPDISVIFARGNEIKAEPCNIDKKIISILLYFEFEDGRHADETDILLTLPTLTSEITKCYNGLTGTKTINAPADAYSHKIGHAVHIALYIDAINRPLN